MQFTWKYGRGQIRFEVPDTNLKAIVKRSGIRVESSPEQMIEAALANPVGTPSLSGIIASRKPEKVVIVVNDITRPVPYRIMLPPLLQILDDNGVRPEQVNLLVANGIHRAQTDAENAWLYGEEVCAKYRVVNHNCDQDLIDLGTLANGMKIEVNRLAVEADLLIVTGMIGLHYLAGYSGGRKSVIPGIAGRSTIEFSHAMMKDPKASLGHVNDNPVHHALTEAARRVRVDFMVNVVINDDKQVVAVVAGDMEQAWLQGVYDCRQDSVCVLEEAADIVIAGCGGFPKDINLYQAQKGLESASQAVREGGVVILVAECPEGLGEDVFERWVREASSLADIKDRFFSKFELGGHKAYAIARTLEKCEVVMVSGMDPELVKKTFLTPAVTVEEALAYAFERMGRQAGIVVIPEAPSLAIDILNKRTQAN